ncbi:MAG: hypothetical protein LUI14_00855 [Lachnospiraceae bacterium]|nr:hypothetical protein [Lachnospiraceae bacterium]
MWDLSYRKALEIQRQQYKDGGGADRIAAQHRKGKLTARERLELLFDEGTFVETGTLIESRTDDFQMSEKKYPVMVSLQALERLRGGRSVSHPKTLQS